MNKAKNISKNKQISYSITILLSILEVINRCLSFALPIFLSQITQIALNLTNVLIILSIILSILLVNFLISYIQKNAIIKYKCKLNTELYDKLFSLKYENIVENGMTYYLEKINLAVNNYANYYICDIPNLIGIIITMIASFVLVGFFNIYILLSIVLVFIIQFVSLKLLNKSLSKRCFSLQNDCAQSFSNILSVLGNTDYVKQQSSFVGINSLLFPSIKRVHVANSNVSFVAQNWSSIINTLVVNLEFVIYILAGILLTSSQIDGLLFLSGIMLINICFNTFSNFSSVQINKNDYNASKLFIEKELNDFAESNKGTKECTSIDSISFNNSNIKYGDNILIASANLNLNKGDVLFLSGETGTGKTSLIKTILRFYDTNNLKINNINIDEYELSSLRNKIYYISQDDYVINDNILNNIYMGNEIKNKDIVQLPFLSKFVDKNEFKNDLIFDSGSNLSGGDKQKIAIARLFNESPDLIILDEITSQMDEETSDKVFDEIINRYKNKIIIIISHNDSIKKYSNKLCSIKNKALLKDE